MKNGILKYGFADGVTAFSTTREAKLPFPVVQAHQVHGDRIALITDPETTRDELEGIDALITATPGIAIGARTADCVPVLLYDPVGKTIAAIHSGWRGTVKRISAETVSAMGDAFGTVPSDLLAVIGPSIGPDSFQVGAEVAQQFSSAGFPMREIMTDEGERTPGTMRGGLHIDLWKANRIVLEGAGILPGNIFLSGIDTYLDPDFYSARREGTQCGRNINAIRLER